MLCVRRRYRGLHVVCCDSSIAHASLPLCVKSIFVAFFAKLAAAVAGNVVRSAFGFHVSVFLEHIASRRTINFPKMIREENSRDEACYSATKSRIRTSRQRSSKIWGTRRQHSRHRSRMFAGTQPRRHASRSRGPQVRRVMYHRANVSEGVYATSSCHLAAR